MAFSSLALLAIVGTAKTVSTIVIYKKLRAKQQLPEEYYKEYSKYGKK